MWKKKTVEIEVAMVASQAMVAAQLRCEAGRVWQGSKSEVLWKGHSNPHISKLLEVEHEKILPVP